MIAAGYIALGVILTVVAEVIACAVAASRLDTVDDGPDNDTAPMPNPDEQASMARHPSGIAQVILARRAIPMSVLDGTGRIGLAVTGLGGAVIVQFQTPDQALTCASKLADKAYAAMPDAPVTQLFDGLADHARGHVIAGTDFTRRHGRDVS